MRKFKVKRIKFKDVRIGRCFWFAKRDVEEPSKRKEDDYSYYMAPFYYCFRTIEEYVYIRVYEKAS